MPRRCADDLWSISADTPAHAQALAAELRASGLWLDVVPGIDSVVVRFDPLVLTTHVASEHIDSVLSSDAVMAKLVGTLSEAGCGVHRRPGLNCWKLPLPTSWDELFEGLSKNRRKAFRKLQRYAFDTGRVEFLTANTDE